MNNTRFKNTSPEIVDQLHKSFISGIFPQVGYTPQNLKFFMGFAGLSATEISKICGVEYPSVLKWRTDLGKENHRAMPYRKWKLLMDIPRCYNCANYTYGTEACDVMNIITGECDIGYYCENHSPYEHS
jgi:hypothetical protein